MIIVDAHAHLGFDEVFDENFCEEELLTSQDTNAINVTLVQPGTVHDLDGVRKQHDAIADLAQRYPGRFYGIANPNPHLPGDQYEREVRRCMHDLGFVGIKLHPMAHAVNPAGKHGRRVFDTASEVGVPVMVHTGAGIPWAAPSLLGPIASRYADLKIVVAHAGAMVLAAEAGNLAEQYGNVYLECSWTAGFLVRRWTKQIGAERLMFGSDHADNAAAELTKCRTCGLDAEELRWVLGETACKVFGLPIENSCE
ncbi:MAG: amidohydrolase family protein [Armatimonadota bacterium]